VSKEVALVIETSVETGTVALVGEDGVVLARSFHAGRKPSAALWGPLEEVMTEVNELAVVVGGLGPGSYNGVRIAIAAAQGIGLMKGCPVVGLCSFEGVGLAGKSLAIGDARRGTFSAQALVSGRCEGKVALVDGDALVRRVGEALAEGREVFCFEEVGRFPLPKELAARVARKQSQAGLLGKAFWERSPEEQAALETRVLEPIYLRAPHITVGKRGPLLDGRDSRP
jgi:tRNA threonylcarbamoyl adenosine modification protein YeaZ